MKVTQRTLSELRESTGLSQNKFAKIIDVSPKTLWLYETDSSNIPDDLIKKYMYLFQIPYECIFIGNKYEKFVKEKESVLERAEKLKQINQDAS